MKEITISLTDEQYDKVIGLLEETKETPEEFLMGWVELLISGRLGEITTYMTESSQTIHAMKNLVRALLKAFDLKDPEATVKAIIDYVTTHITATGAILP
jgi:hypothetical protein